MTKITMPQAGQSMEEGTIVRWHKKEGDAVAKGEVLFEIETDKSTIEVEAAESGVLSQILVPAGQTVPVHTPIAMMSGGSESESATPAAPAQPAPAAPASAAAAPVNVQPILMPQAGQSVEEATLVKWHVQPGATIKKGDVIFEVETDKSVVEVEATEEGRLARIVVAEGQMVPVLQPVAYIAASDAEVDAFLAAQGQAPAPAAPAAPAPAPAPAKQAAAPAPAPAIPSPAPVAVASNGGRVKASPAARRVANERGLDLHSVGAGSGPGGRILSSDLQNVQPAAASNKPRLAPVVPATSEPIRRKLSGMRKAIARNLSFSKQNVPHWYIQRVINAGPMLAFYKGQKANYPCSVNDVITLACSRVLMEFPAFRSQFHGDEMVEFPNANIGIAVAIDEGLVVPVVQNVEGMTLQQVGAESKRVAELARKGKIEAMGKGVFTISNLGMFGVDQFTAIINPPEAAILAVSGAKEAVIVKDGAMRAGKTMSLTLSADHRVIDGALAAKFMARLVEVLEAPEQLL